MSRFYFSETEESESCYPLEHYLKYMIENNIEVMELKEAVIDRGSGYFYCKEYMEVGTVGEGCGKGCEFYQPRNGKSGICKQYGYVYSEGKSKIIRINSVKIN